MTYILPPSALRQPRGRQQLLGCGGHRPAAPHCTAGETPPRLGVPAAAQPWAGTTEPVTEARPPGPRPVPNRRHPLTAPARGKGGGGGGPAPTWRGRWRKVSPGRGEAGSAPSLPKRPALGEREGRERGREGRCRPGKSPSATGQPGPALIPQEGGIPLKPALTERPGGSVPSGRASSPHPPPPPPPSSRRPQLGTSRRVCVSEGPGR